MDVAVCAPTAPAIDHAGLQRIWAVANRAANSLRRRELCVPRDAYDMTATDDGCALLRDAAAAFGWPPPDTARSMRFALAATVATAAVPGSQDPQAALLRLADRYASVVGGDLEALHAAFTRIAKACSLASASPGCITRQMGSSWR